MSNTELELTIFTRFYVTLTYLVVILFGYVRDFVSDFFASESLPAGYAPLLDGFNAHYTKHLFGRISDAFDRPISSTPGSSVEVMERVGVPFHRDLKTTGKSQTCLNLGSYNYLGFAKSPQVCSTKNKQAVESFSTCSSSSRLNLGTLDLHRELEKKIAKFLHKDDSVIFSMGYAVNSTGIASLIGPGGLILSDSLNHASLVTGCRLSGAQVKVFQHNDFSDLERILRCAITMGQSSKGKTHKPWTKILIVVEGLYSMEGEVPNLPKLIELKKKYKVYLYLDEAHSIGALGESGRGICEYWGVDFKEVDVLMGTLTKSFASCGGYMAASQDIVDSIKAFSFSGYYDSPMSAVCAQQILSTLSILMGEDGTQIGKEKISTLKKNSIEFRRMLKERNFVVIGEEDSPVVPVLLYSPIKIHVFSRACLENNLAVVVVGFPATSLFTARARFCISASHTIEELQRAVDIMTTIAQDLLILDTSEKHPVKKEKESQVRVLED